MLAAIAAIGGCTVLMLARYGRAQQPAAKKAPAIGYSDTPVIPGQKWRVHDIDRPRPRVVTPASEPGSPPSDAIILFDGKDLSKWQTENGGDARWKVENGYVEIMRRTGNIVTRDKFGDVQLHIEWASPAEAAGASQGRGNSGVLLMKRYEVQVLDSHDNVTYADGQAGALYGQWPPLVNASRKPSEWQTYDIVFEAPRFDGGKLIKPVTMTVFHNGIVVHNRQEMLGPAVHRVLPKYEAHGDESLMLQDHGNPVRFRNIWVRKLTKYDES